MKNQIQAHIREIRIILLVLIVLGLALLATQSYWVPSVVQSIISHDEAPVVITASSTTKSATKATPGGKKTVSNSNVIAGADITVLVGPSCSVQTANGACGDKPYETTLVFKNFVTGADVVAAKTDAAGHISQALNPGTYMVRSQSVAAFPHLETAIVTVKPHTRTKVTLHFDSGIR